jgi:hypothetical protein
MAASAYENLVHAPLTHAQIMAAMEGLLKQPPRDFDNRIYLSRAIRESDEDPTIAARENVERLAKLMQKAQQLGVRIMLFQLPLPKEIEATRMVEITRRIWPLCRSHAVAGNRCRRKRIALAGWRSPRRTVRDAGRPIDRQGAWTNPFGKILRTD